MASVNNSLTGLSVLMQQGGPLSSLSTRMSPAQLESAPSKDIVSLSMAALHSQEADGLFGVTPASQTTLPVLPAASTPGSASPDTLLPGVSSADMANATPQEQSSLNDSALALQQAQALFAQPASTTGSTSVYG